MNIIKETEHFTFFSDDGKYLSGKTYKCLDCKSSIEDIINIIIEGNSPYTEEDIRIYINKDVFTVSQAHDFTFLLAEAISMADFIKSYIREHSEWTTGE